ncbi:hypothetical protein ACK32O_00900 [Aeromonas enteropelogenes]|uniref:hypothetical protein n=1 Tax=Aeromonas enteropelogenes TaxID=29489 RepID=UPI0039880577
MTLYGWEAKIKANRRAKYGTERMGPARKLTTVMQRSVRQFLVALMMLTNFTHNLTHTANIEDSDYRGCRKAVGDIFGYRSNEIRKYSTFGLGHIEAEIASDHQTSVRILVRLGLYREGCGILAAATLYVAGWT